jgi:UDP-N-acetylglucosamine acyltransferase
LPRIHPTAVVDPAAKLADDVEIGPHACVGPEVELAQGVELKPHALVTGRTRIGERTRVFPFAVLGEEPQDKAFSGKSTELVIGCDNVLREHVTIHVGTEGSTRIGDDNMILNGTHIGHDGLVGSHTIIASFSGLAGHVTVEDHAVIGAFTGVHQFTRIGESAMVAAKAGISKDVPPFSLVAGDRARLMGLNNIGIRRRGIDEQAHRHLKRAFHLLFNSRRRFEEAVQQVRAEIEGCAEVDRLLAFLESSERGFVR